MSLRMEVVIWRVEFWGEGRGKSSWQIRQDCMVLQEVMDLPKWMLVSRMADI